jgi:hypothetical protein
MLYYRIMVLNFQFVQFFLGTKLILKKCPKYDSNLSEIGDRARLLDKTELNIGTGTVRN